MPHTASPRTPEALDVARLDLLTEQLGDAEVVAELVGMLLEDLTERVDRGRSAAEAGDLEVSRREAHSLCSASRQLGGDLLAESAAAVEHGRADWTAVQHVLPAAREAWSAWLAGAGHRSPILHGS